VSTAAEIEESAQASGFSVNLEVFEGPFDLLLSLISKHKLDITDVALSQVTDEFLAYIRSPAGIGDSSTGRGPHLGGDLEKTTHFLLVAATLLDLKTARLLPQGDVEDEEDLALLEARDLLFARLMQYRAFKQAAAQFEARLEVEARRYPRSVSLDPRFADVLPEVVVSIGPHELARLAAAALEPKPVPLVSLSHLHAPQVSVREQVHLLVDRLRRERGATFRALVADADVPTTVARFLAVLELFREGAVAFEQASPMGDLHLRWIGDENSRFAEGAEFDIGAEFDEEYAEEMPTDDDGNNDD
jgi:segregation and condensation protein A